MSTADQQPQIASAPKWKSYRLVADQEKAIKEAKRDIEKTTSKNILVIGQQLISAQATLAKFGEGTFIKWCSQRLGLKKTTAYKYIRVAHRFRDCPHCAQTIAPSALYVLSDSKTPPRVVKTAIKLAEGGHFISYGDARKMVSDAYKDGEGHFDGDGDDDGDDENAPKKSPPGPKFREAQLLFRRLVEIRDQLDDKHLRRLCVWFEEYLAARAKSRRGFVGFAVHWPKPHSVNGHDYANAILVALRMSAQCDIERLPFTPVTVDKLPIAVDKLPSDKTKSSQPE